MAMLKMEYRVGEGLFVTVESALGRETFVMPDAEAFDMVLKLAQQMHIVSGPEGAAWPTPLKN